VWKDCAAVLLFKEQNLEGWMKNCWNIGRMEERKSGIMEGWNIGNIKTKNPPVL